MAYADFGKKYPLAGYGTMFKQWIEDFTHQPYHSFGNGSAMRVSFIGEYFPTIERVREEARKKRDVYPQPPRRHKGAGYRRMFYLAKHGYSKRQIKHYIERNFNYRLNRPLFMTRPFQNLTSPARSLCRWLFAVFWRVNPEDCIRNVFSITCDTGTIGCIAGGIAEVFFIEGPTGMTTNY